MGSFTFVDLFAGIGGFHHAAVLAAPGSHCVMAVEWDRACQAVYSAAFPTTTLVSDVREITRRSAGAITREATAGEIDQAVPDHDVLFAGFPCQPFSKGGEQDGLRDETRGTLFHDIAAIVRAKRPGVILLENVANLISHDDGNTWRVIRHELIESGYQLDDEPLVLSPHELEIPYGSPHHRRRVFVVASDRAQGLPAPLPNRSVIAPADRRGSPWNIHEVLTTSSVDANTSLSERELKWLHAWDEFVMLMPDERLPSFPIWVDSWFSRMAPPRQRRGSGATRRREIGTASKAEADWWHRFNAANYAFFGDQRRRRLIKTGLLAECSRISRQPAQIRVAGRRGTADARIKIAEVTSDPVAAEWDSCATTTYAPALVAMAQTPIVGDGQAGGGSVHVRPQPFRT